MNSMWWGQQYCHGGMQQALRVTVCTQHTPTRYTNPQHTKVCVVLRACSQGCARTTQHTPIPQTKRRKARGGKKNRNRRVVLDGGGARLADAATRHHLTQTQEEEENNNEQNKHQRTQTIQKTSTRQSTTARHHTLPSMRNQTPIHKQRTTQTQQCRGRPHNPSLARRIQPPGQRQSIVRQMQQQTRQRQRRQRKSTPLPEKR